MNAPETQGVQFQLDYASKTPWNHEANETMRQRLSAAQRMGGILLTDLMRQQHASYDAALKASGVEYGDPFTHFPVNDASVNYLGEVIRALKESTAHEEKTVFQPRRSRPYQE